MSSVHAYPTDAERVQLAVCLRELADRAACADTMDEFEVLKDGLAPLFDGLRCLGWPVSIDVLKAATRQLLEGAFESAVLGLIPADAMVTGVRIGTDGATAQVAFADGPGHSGEAKTLALAWASALARALTGLIEEMVQPSTGNT